METIDLTTIKKEISVAASQQTAFKVFTEQMGLWWPASGHTEDCPMVRVGLEAKTGGRWYGMNSDGVERELGRVLVYEPYALFALDWQIDNALRFDPELHTEVRVEFIPEGDKSTRVKLTHRGLQHIGDAAGGIDEGWTGIMETYQAFITQSFSVSITTCISPDEALQKISKVKDWWGVGFEGNAEKRGDHFVIKMGPEAYFNCTVTEFIPGKKMIWTVSDCYMPWYNDKQEWKDTQLIFELSAANDQTTLIFTHEGLTPDVDCYKDCNPGWTHWITRSLLSYFNTGQGDFKQR